MITEKQIAGRVAAASEGFVEALNKALLEVQATATPAEFERFRRAVGMIVGRLEVKLLSPLYKEHPELEPEGLRSGPNDI